jgi:predicted nucleic acid-binding protein
VTAFVLDASAYVFAYTAVSPAAGRLRSRISVGAVHAPHLIVAEVGSVVRRTVRAGAIKQDRAFALVEQVTTTARLYPHGPLVRVVWSLRDNLSFYDALYASLAVTLGIPLLTSDARLARAPGLPFAVEVISWRRPGPVSARRC